MRALRWFVVAGLLGLGCDKGEQPGSMQPPVLAGTSGVSGAAGFAGAAAAGGAGAAGMPVGGAAGAAPAIDSGIPQAGSSAGAGGAGQAGGGGAGAGAGGAGSGGSGSGGAGGAGAGGEGGGAASGFQPCPQSGDPCKVLPLGDSITAGIGSSGGGGYRLPLFSKVLEAGQSITYVGSQMSGPSMVDGASFPRNHEGHSGRTIDFIAGRVPDPAFDDPPHIILLMIGTNDMYMQPSGAPDRLADLLDEILMLQPETLLVVAQLTPFPRSDMQVRTYNAAIPAIVEERAERGEHILLVDMYTDFPASNIGDGVHPNAQGYELMADRWYAAIAEFLPQAP
jgi:lysophospholipase L1-like esterase